MNRTCFAMGLVLLFCSPPVKAQEKSLKTNPTVFYRETFNWGNPADAKGWTAPPGYLFTDPLDNGYTWHWWPNDSMNCSTIAEPPFRSTSRDDGHLCIFGAWYNTYRNYWENLPVNSSIVFPPIDCSKHSSVILQFETNFLNYGYQGMQAGGWHCTVEVSPDNGIHWNQFNASFGIISGSRPNDGGPGEAALFRENITEIAAGREFVVVKLTWWAYFGMYFWNVDDLQLTEAVPNDLRLDKIDIQWDDKDPTTTETVSYSIPVSQVGSGRSLEQFKTWVTNMGANEATNIVFDVTVKKEEVTVFQESKTIPSLFPGYKDSLLLSGKYEPKEKGTYSIEYSLKQDNPDDLPEDNRRTVTFKVSDSVYNRAGDVPDYTFSYNNSQYIRDDWATEVNMNHFMGSAFPIYEDCEIDGISAYITGGLANGGLIDFGYLVTYANWDFGIIHTQQLMKTDRLFLDSAMFNTWVYLPFTKDGESEFVKGGSMLWGGIQYTNWHNTEALRRYKGMSMGGTHQVPIHEAPAMTGNPNPMLPEGFGWNFVRTKNLMVRLYLHSSVNSTDPDGLAAFSVSQNYPNPFSDHTGINYSLGQEARVTLEITDLTGRVVLIKDDGLQPSGNHRLMIQNPGLSPGIYFYTLYAGVNKQTRKMIVN